MGPLEFWARLAHPWPWGLDPEAQNLDFPCGFSRVGANNDEKTIGFLLSGAQARPPRAKMERTSRAESGVRNSPPDPADPPEMVSGAAVQTLPNHAQDSQDDVSSQANSLKLKDVPELRS